MAEVCITGAMRTTPSDALDAILNIPPIRQISIEMSTLAAIRLRDLDYWKDHLTGHSSILLKNNNIPSKTDYCMPTEHMATPFHTLIPNRDEWTSATPGQEGALSFYTDGSKLDNQKPAEEDITEEIECPELPELDGYVSDASTITRDLSALCTRADQEVILDVASDDEDANQTVVEVISSDVP
ncbi:hypothetical protein ACLKA7_001228 [Drosophila subpalustris]